MRPQLVAKVEAGNVNVSAKVSNHNKREGIHAKIIVDIGDEQLRTSARLTLRFSTVRCGTQYHLSAQRCSHSAPLRIRFS